MEKEVQIHDTKIIALILGVANIKSIEKSGTLEQRLIQKNCRLLEKFKEGRKAMYKIEIIQNVSDFSANELCNKHKIKKKEKFKFHAKNRYNSIKGENNLATQQQFANKINEDRYTIKKFDNVLLEEDFMIENGFRYWAYKDGKMLYETSRESYNKFWKDNQIKQQTIKLL